jgi:hypothetical protein
MDALGESVKNAKAFTLALSFIIYHALQLQYFALNFEPGSAQLCRARKLLRLAGICFLIAIFGSPKRTSLTTLPSFANTADFLGPPGVDFGLL